MKFQLYRIRSHNNARQVRVCVFSLFFFKSKHFLTIGSKPNDTISILVPNVRVFGPSQSVLDQQSFYTRIIREFTEKRTAEQQAVFVSFLSRSIHFVGEFHSLFWGHGHRIVVYNRRRFYKKQIFNSNSHPSFPDFHSPPYR